jgi:aminopeptidase N
MNRVFYHQTVSTGQIENFLAAESGLQLDAFFNQYLRTADVPRFQYYWKDGKFFYRWTDTVKGFAMPVEINQNNTSSWISPENNWKSTDKLTAEAAIAVDPNFYIMVQQIQPIE